MQTPPAHPIAAISDFLLPRANAATVGLLDNRHLELTFNCRGALFSACEEIGRAGRPEILVPAFHCPSGITPVIRAGLTPRFYRIHRDLSIDYDDLHGKISPATGAVLVIHFLGIAADLKPLARLRERGIALIEDWSHSFLAGTPPALAGGDSDYRVFSFWKTIPCGVGGGLYRSNVPARLPRRPPSPLREGLTRTKRMFEEAIDHSDPSLVRSAFMGLERLRLAMKRPAPKTPSAPDEIPGEARYPFDPRLAASAMPALSKRIIEASDLNAVMRRRRANFAAYGRLLHDAGALTLMRSALPESACPWVFPVLLSGRDDLDHRWRAAGVALHTFGIYLHSRMFASADDRTIEDARFLADNLLCLSIHQCIGSETIERSAKIIMRSLTSRP